MVKRRTVALILGVLVGIGIGSYLLVRKPAGRAEIANPEGTFEKFVHAFNERDAGGAYGYFSSRVQASHPIQEMEGFLELARSTGSKITGWKVLEKSTSDSSALLRVQVSSVSLAMSFVENDRVPMILEEGRWLFDEWYTDWTENISKRTAS